MNQNQILLIAITIIMAVFVSSIMLIISPKSAILWGLLVPALVLSFRYPRWGLLAFLIYLPLSGTIAYSLAGIFQTSGARVVYTADYPFFHLAKDAFYFPALLAILILTPSFQKLRSHIKPLLWSLLLLLAVSCLTFLFVNFPQQLTATKGSPLLMGIIGLKGFLGYIPLILCGYYLIRDRQDLLLVNRLLITIIIICCGLCFIQYFFLLSGICRGNPGLPEQLLDRPTLQARCLVGGSLLYNPELGLIRLPGTFVAPWQWAWFLISSSFISYAASLSEPSRRWRIISWIAMAFVLGAAIISGQRTALMLVPIILLVLLLLTEKQLKSLPIKLISIAILTAIIVSQVGIVQQQIQSLISRWNYSPPPEFMAKQLQWLFQDRLQWLGHGLGRATSAARNWGNTQLIETFYVKVLYEVGLLGFLAFLAVVSTLTVLTYKAYRSLENPSLRSWGLCLWIFVLFISYNPYYYPLAVDPIAVYYWFLAGMLLKLPELESQERMSKYLDVKLN
jgi:hypothetical protein